MDTHHERGIALVLALFLMTALSVLGASLMFLAQTETYSSMNYRMMSQARYAGESAVQKAANFLLDPNQYTPPTTAQLAAYNYAVSPVTLVSNNLPVVLSATTSIASNYAAGEVTPGGVPVTTAFNTAGQGSLTAANAAITYNASATLIAMQTFTSYGGGPVVVQTWQITGDGTLSGSRRATIEVSATIQTPKVPANSYAAFGTDSGCGALTFGGNVKTDSYNPAGLVGGAAPTLEDEGGDVGTNGNLTISGHVDVNGNLVTPRTGVGACVDGGAQVTALTESGAAEVSGSVIKLPTAVNYPTPTIPAPSVLPEVSLSSGGVEAVTCALFGLTPVTQCTVVGNTITINGNGATLSLPSLSTTAHVDIVLVASNPAAQYNFNSVSLGGGSSIGVSATSSSQTVVVDVVGKNPDGSVIDTPIDFTGGTYAAVTGCATCSAYDAAMLQFVYGGDGDIILSGNSSAAAVFYAPNAAVTFHGTADLYGSVLAKTIDDNSGASIHYDSNLQGNLWMAGSPVIGTFTWKRY
jgi:hypothetical protein